MGADSRVIFAQKRFDAARREIREAVVDFGVSDEKLLELRANARQAHEELRALDRQNLKSGLLAAFKFW
jgi:hypothetical protein